MFNLKDKIAIITGASQGIGKSTAKIFSNAGAHVVCLARNKEKIQHLVDQISKDGNSASYLPCDISDSNLFFVRQCFFSMRVATEPAFL